MSRPQELPDFCECYLDAQPQSGAWNMAADECLLQQAIQQGICSLRFYSWDQPTLSLGYFQNREEANDRPEWQHMPMVRRLTGGGAILHQHEITYSVAVPKSHPGTRPVAQLYQDIHQQVVNGLLQFGIATRFRGESVQQIKAESFLCFGRGDNHDLLMHGHKVLGSAQRRRKGAVLQHGSLLWKQSEWAPEHPGITDLATITIDSRELQQVLINQIGGILARQIQFASWDDQKILEIGHLSQAYSLC